MCGISGILGFADSFAVSEALARDMAAAQSHRGPDDDGAWADPAAPRRPESSAALDHRPVGRRPPAHVQRGRDRLDHLQRRGLQPRGAALRAGGQGPHVPLAHRHRDDPAPLRGGGPGLRLAPGRDVRLRHLGRPPPPARARARPARRQAAALRAAAPGAGLRLRGARHPAPPGGAPGARRRRVLRLSDLRVRAPARHPVQGHPQARRGGVHGGQRRRSQPARALLVAVVRGRRRRGPRHERGRDGPAARANCSPTRSRSA